MEILRWDDPAHDTIVKDIVALDDFLRRQCDERFNEMVGDWQLYLGQKQDTRKEHEQWRANIKDGRPTRNMDVLGASIASIHTSADPWVQALGVGDEDMEGAMGIERLVEYTLTRNGWPRHVDLFTRSSLIQGIDHLKLTWKKDARVLDWVPSPRDMEEWQKSVQDAEVASSTKAPIEPSDYMKWRDTIHAAFPHIKIPEMPVPGRREFIRYEGPWIDRPSAFDMVYDPLVEQVQDQPYFRQRVLVSSQWIQKQIDSGAFDAEAVAHATGVPDVDRHLFVASLAKEMRVPSNSITENPFFNDLNELWEVWQPFDEEMPFKCLLNRRGCVNKNYGWPYAHGMVPHVAVRNVPIAGFFVGVGEFRTTRGLYRELEMHRNLRLDSVLMSTIGIWAKRKDIGLPDAAKAIHPGMLLELMSADALRRVDVPGPPAVSYNEVAEMSNDLDEMHGTYGSQRGADAAVGRVAATEFQGRSKSAQGRIVQRAVRMEEDLQPLVPMMLSLWHEFGSYESRANIMGGDPLKGLSKDRLLQALGEDYKFRGASQASNREMVAQQLMGVFGQFGQVLPPTAVFTLLREILNTMGIKSARRIVTDQMLTAAAAPPPPTGGPVGAEVPAGEGGPTTAPLPEMPQEMPPGMPPEGMPPPGMGQGMMQ